MNYQPRPIDTSGVTLPEHLLKLRERLAEHIHDIWALKRLSEGWTYGATRDDARKRHPCLVHYSELPEEEKAYDRAVAVETLKAITALGYKIKK